MPTADEIRDAVAADAEMGVDSATVAGESVKLMSVADRLKAAESAAGEVAATKPHFGVRFGRIVPPSCG